jgi:hypothetical protein
MLVGIPFYLLVSYLRINFVDLVSLLRGHDACKPTAKTKKNVLLVMREEKRTVVNIHKRFIFVTKNASTGSEIGRRGKRKDASTEGRPFNNSLALFLAYRGLASSLPKIDIKDGDCCM